MANGHLKAARRAWGWSLLVYAQNPGRFRLYKRHLRWAVAASIRQAEALHWFDFLENSDMGPFLKAHPRLVFRPFSQYICLGWNWARRVKVIRETYEVILKRGGFLLEAMTAQDGAILARFDLDRGQTALIRLKADSQFRKEGEIGVSLELAGLAGSVTAFALSFEQEPGGGWVGLLGSLQGRKGGDEEVIKLATKVFHGLRPKNLMLLLAQELAKALGLSALRGIGNRIQVFRARMNNPLVPTRRIHFDYDEFWTESGGTPRADGWFELPLNTPPKASEDIKPNKRSMYAKRYALMAELSRQIGQRLNDRPDNQRLEPPA